MFGGVYVVSDNQIFVAQQSPGSGSRYQAYGELSHFVYCTLQKIKTSEWLPLVERCENYMLPNHCICRNWGGAFPGGDSCSCNPRKNNELLSKKEFLTSACRFLEEFCTTILLTIAAWAKLCQGVSCFRLEKILRGDDFSASFLYGQLLDGLVECDWERGSNVEACNAEFQSFIREQRQLECLSTRKRPERGDILAYVSQQTGFKCRQHLFRVSSVLLEDAGPCHQSESLVVVGVSINDLVSAGLFRGLAQI